MKTLEKIGNRISIRLHDHSTMVLHITVTLLILFIILTRISGLTYNMFLHPDEWVFYRGSSSLARAILNSETAFTEVKEYPEGTYLFQAPFHLLKILVAFLSGIPQNDQIWGRISSVFYFVLAIIVGIRILMQFWGGSKASCIIYPLTMCFSVFFIEHSRYGVGDMCSLFLMMLILYFTAQALASAKQYFFALACMAGGSMGAVKYPQLFFVVIPICAYLFTSEHRKSKKIVVFAFLILTTVCTVLFFSPKALEDPHYFLRVIEREANAYVMKGTTFEDGGILNHLAGMVLFTLLYSDFPFSFVFVSYSFYRLLKEPIDTTKPTDLLFCKIVPIVCIVFFIYNLFAKLLVLRTYTPYFSITILYCSQFVAKLFHKRWKGFAIALALTFIMILRGGWLIAITSSQSAINTSFSAKIASAVDANWSKTTIMPPYNLAENLIDEIADNQFSNTEIQETRLLPYVETNNGMRVQTGELLITGSYEFALAHPYIFPVNDSDTYAQDAAWNEFKERNKYCYVGQSYPEYYYYLFGGWIRGSTLSTSLIPCNYIYYGSLQ